MIIIREIYMIWVYDLYLESCRWDSWVDPSTALDPIIEHLTDDFPLIIIIIMGIHGQPSPVMLVYCSSSLI